MEKTLKPYPGSMPFAGFLSGQQIVVAVGHLDGSDFNVVWVGMGNVR